MVNMLACPSIGFNKDFRAVLDWLDLEWVASDLVNLLALTSTTDLLKLGSILQIFVNIAAFGKA